MSIKSLDWDDSPIEVPAIKELTIDQQELFKQSTKQFIQTQLWIDRLEQQGCTVDENPN